MHSSHYRERFETEKTENSTLEQVTNLCENFRDIVEIAWSKNTSYPKSESRGRFDSLGQCIVSSRLLQDVLKEKFPDINTKLCLGKINIKIDDKDVDIPNHGWLEVDIDGDDKLIIDITPDQFHELPIDDKTVIRLKSSLKDDLNYQTELIQSDEDLKSSSAFKRYEILKNRYNKIQSKEDYYKQLFKSNIYLLGSVASGKSETSYKLTENLPFEAVDVGNIFRLISYQIFSNSEIGIDVDWEQIKNKDEKYISTLVSQIQRKSNSIRDVVKGGISLQKNKETGKQEVLYNDKAMTKNELRSKQVNDIVAIVSKITPIRNLVWSIIKEYSNENGGIILTGHSLKDIDTSKYTVINLKVDEDIATDRVLKRESGQYSSKEEAKEAIKNRNLSDGYDKTAKIVEKLFRKKEIDTSDLTPQQVKFRILRNIAEGVQKRKEREDFQRESEMSREEFKWNINPVLAYIREAGKEIFTSILDEEAKNGVTEFDLSTQVIMHLSVHELKDIWQGDEELLDSIKTMLDTGDVDNVEKLFLDNIKNGKIWLNNSLVKTEAERQAKRIKNAFKNLSISNEQGENLELPFEYMNNRKNSPFGEQEGTTVSKKGAKYSTVEGVKIMSVKEKITGKKIIFKPVSKDIAELYGQGFHYLHQGRSDNYADFGAFVEGDNMPFAWVSYSPVDREYKKEMLDYVGVESHRFLEMTRAWNSSWAPKNTMSVLFDYAHSSIKETSKDKAKAGEVDKPIQGVLTAINPNLGFKASGFTGIGMSVIGLKPASFSFLNNGEDYEYMPRRSIQKKLGLKSTKELQSDPRYKENSVPLLPTYELILAFDNKEQKRLEELPVYKIDKGSYKGK